MKEIWKDVPADIYAYGIRDVYQASNTGKIRNKITGRILKLSPYRRNNKRFMVQLRGMSNGSLTFRADYVIWETWKDSKTPTSFNKHIFRKDYKYDNLNIENLYIAGVENWKAYHYDLVKKHY